MEKYRVYSGEGHRLLLEAFDEESAARRAEGRWRRNGLNTLSASDVVKVTFKADGANTT